jgi:hypothetical protein
LKARVWSKESCYVESRFFLFRPSQSGLSRECGAAADYSRGSERDLPMTEKPLMDDSKTTKKTKTKISFKIIDA